MADEVHQPLTDAITDAAQVGAVQPVDVADTPMNDDDEVVEPVTGDTRK